MRWDIFCKVIDNHGDIGVCWRLACDLAARGEQVRLWADELSALAWMAPDWPALPAGLLVHDWQANAPFQMPPDGPGDVLVEAFGCEAAIEIIAAPAISTASTGQNRIWINLEYLSAEPFVERAHGLPSPLQSGPGRGQTRHFFYPGFTPRTGGLLREASVAPRQAVFDRAAWRARQRAAEQHSAEQHAAEQWISLFCYEPAALPDLLRQLAAQPRPTRLLVTAGRATAAVQQALAQCNSAAPGWNAAGQLRVAFVPLMTQAQFDELLMGCDLNFVRGEDSVVRAIWAGQPFVWQIYPQDDGAHAAKLDALLDQLDAPPGWRAFMRAWNGLVEQSALPPLNGPDWAPHAQAFAARLRAQDDLTTQLLRFVQEKR